MTQTYLFLLSPPVRFRALINMPGTITYPIQTLTFDTVSAGIYSNVGPPQTLLLGTSAGDDDLGRQRVRRLATTTTIPIGRTSQGVNDGELDVQDNAYITVLEDFRVWARIPFIDLANNNTIYKDSDFAAAGNAEDPPPVAVAGGGFAATINAGTGRITVSFDASASVQYDPAVSDSLSPITNFLWEVDDGMITSGTISSASITATFPAGFRWVWLTVTAASGKAHQIYIPVFARDPNNDACIDHQVVSQRLTKSGQEVSIRIMQDITRAQYPDGTLAMLWDREPATPSDRSHMQFIGWHQSDEGGIRAERTATLRDSILHFVDVAGRLKTLPGFPQVLEAGIPSSWQYTRYPNVFAYLHYLLYWHSTALHVADLVLGTQILNNFAFKILSSDQSTLYDQANDLANRITPDHWLTCNQQGQLMLVVDPIIQNVADRDGTIYQTLSSSTWSEIHFTYERPPRVYKLLTGAVLSDAATVTGIFSMAPGMAEGQGATTIETSERITQGQFDINKTEGNRYARVNARTGPVTITMPYDLLNRTVQPARMGWVQLGLNPWEQTPRPMVPDIARCLVHEINIAYDYQPTGLVRTATLTLEVETSGPAAQTYVPPAASTGLRQAAAEITPPAPSVAEAAGARIEAGD
jgi:hypothetical protein